MRQSWRRSSAAIHAGRRRGRRRSIGHRRQRRRHRRDPGRARPAEHPRLVREAGAWTSARSRARSRTARGPDTRSRCRRHRSWATGPPIEYPTAMTGPVPSATSVSAVSSAQSASRKMRRVRRPRAWPRRSGATMLKCCASGSNTRNQLRPPLAIQPCSSSSVGAPGGPVDLADERRAALRQVDAAAERERRFGHAGPYAMQSTR